MSLFNTTNLKFNLKSSSNVLSQLSNNGLFKNTNTLIDHINSITSIYTTPCGKYIITGSIDMRVCVWNIKNEKCIQTYITDKKHISNITYNPYGQYLASKNKKTTVINISNRYDCHFVFYKRFTFIGTGLTFKILDNVQSICYSKHIFYKQSFNIWNINSPQCFQICENDEVHYLIKIS